MTKCPYCFSSDNFEQEPKRRPDQELLKCSSCLKYFVLNTRNDKTYCLAKPEDKNSPPQVNKK